MARLVELVGAGEPRWPRADDGHALARALGGRLGDEPALLKPRSMMLTSSFFIATAGIGMAPTVQAPSQGAGQTRPVNSGKLLVSSRRLRASRQRPRYSRSFHLGMRLLIGQPEAAPSYMTAPWQKGVPQSMQRAAWSRNSSLVLKAVWNSFQSFTRSAGARSGGSARSYSIKPVGLAIHHLTKKICFDYR